jgi:hypothetical protein
MARFNWLDLRASSSAADSAGNDPSLSAVQSVSLPAGPLAGSSGPSASTSVLARERRRHPCRLAGPRESAAAG